MRRSPLQVGGARGLGTQDGGSGLELRSQRLVAVPLRDPRITVSPTCIVAPSNHRVALAVETALDADVLEARAAIYKRKTEISAAIRAD